MSEPTLRDLVDKVDDVARVLSRQVATLGALAEVAGPATAPDVPLLVELHALCNDAARCAATTRARRERAAFTAMAGSLDRLLVGRGGNVVAPAVGEAFSGTRMEAVEVVTTDDPAQDRTVAALLEPGLSVGDRSVRPARVTVFRHHPTARGGQPDAT